MAWAKEVSVSDCLAIGLCADKRCSSRHPGVSEPDFGRIDVIADDEGIETILDVSGADLFEVAHGLGMIRRKSEIIEAYMDCGGVVELESGEIMCGALAKLRGKI